jgi:hypothetical protein
MDLEKINLDIKMDFMNLKFEIWNLKKIWEIFSCLIFFILSVMVLQCVVVKSYNLNFQLHYKKNIHNDNFFVAIWIVTLDVPSFVKSTLDWTFILLMKNNLGLKD